MRTGYEFRVGLSGSFIPAFYPPFHTACAVRLVEPGTIALQCSVDIRMEEDFGKGQIVLWMVIQPSIGNDMPKRMRRYPFADMPQRQFADDDGHPGPRNSRSGFAWEQVL